MAPDRHRLRARFEEVPELYDRARPVYPAQVFDDLVELAGLPKAGRVLEIGCGTGQATLPLAERGFEIVCVELGEQLAEVARQKLSAFPKVEIFNASFESWEPSGHFDAIVAFTAFHWIDPEVRYAKPARLLGKHGALAVVATQHVLPEDGDPFFVQVQRDYEAVVPHDEKTQGGAPPRPDAVGDLGNEIEAGGYFRPVAARRYLWNVTYSADEYIAVLDTYSGHRSLDEPTRQELYERIRRRIDHQPGRKVEKSYLATMNVAQGL